MKKTKQIFHLQSPLSAVHDLFSKCNIPYVIIGGVASRSKDLEDIQNIARRYKNINKPYILRWIRQFAQVLEKPELTLVIKNIINS